MPTLQAPWGDRFLEIPLPPGWQCLGSHEPRSNGPSGTTADLCRQALSAPIAARPLADRDLAGKRVLLVADDVSRPTPVHRFFGAVRDDLLRAGVQDSNIEILFALGVHRPMTAAEAAAKIGPENAARHRWHNHDAFDPSKLRSLGTTSRGTPVVLNRLLGEFDLLVLLGAIEPHLLLGFGGGLKMLLPGCAGAETVGRNHLQGVGGGRFNYVGSSAERSPMRLDLEEAAGMIGKDIFLVNGVLDSSGEVGRFFCGDPIQAFRSGLEYVRGRFAVPVAQQADVVIANSRPLDADLRQGSKCLGNTLYAAKPGGIVLGLLRCAEGRGDMPLPSWTLPYGLLRRMVRIARKERILTLLRLIRRHDPVEQQFLTHFGLQMLRRNHIWVYSDNLEPDTGRRIGAYRQFPTVSEMIQAAERHVGPRATYAYFPWGGATYVDAPPNGD